MKAKFLTRVNGNCNLEAAILKHILVINILSISCEIALKTTVPHS